MLNMFLRATVLTALMCGGAAASYAQDCNVNYEMATRLFHPDPGSYAIWQANIGEPDRLERFTSVVLPVDSPAGAVVVGEVRERETATPTMMMAQVDHRGRSVWEKFISVDRLSSVVKILPTASGYIVAANAGKGVWIGFFDAQGGLLGNRVISADDADLDVNDMIKDEGEGGYVLAATREIRTGSGKNQMIRKEGAIYQIDTGGSVAWKRSFPVGEQSEILGISFAKFKNDQGSYIATGYVESKDGRRLATVLRLGVDGDLMWQQEYERGLTAQFIKGAGYYERYILAFGDVRLADSEPIGSWLALLDADDGKVHWQRYYAAQEGQHDYFARGVSVNRDHLITVMMQAQALDKTALEKKDEKNQKKEEGMVGDITIPESMNYTHVLTLSPRGVVLAGDSYFYGQGTEVSALIEAGNGSRLMVGSTMAQSTVGALSRDFKPDWDLDFSYGPNPIEGSTASVSSEVPVKPNLPQAELSENTKSGLALLNKKLTQQIREEGITSENETQSDKNKKSVQDESDSNQKVGSSFSENGWIVMGAAPEPYVDPCKIPDLQIPKR